MFQRKRNKNNAAPDDDLVLEEQGGIGEVDVEVSTNEGGEAQTDFDAQQYDRLQQQQQRRQRGSVILPDRSVGGFDDFGGGVGGSDLGDDSASRLYSILAEAVAIQREERNKGDGDGELSSSGFYRRHGNLELVWKDVRQWFDEHPDVEDRAAAAYIRGEGDETPLHLLCQLKNAPVDFVANLLEAAEEVAGWCDSMGGWLPLHLACANSQAAEILLMLIQAYPDGKITQDSQNRTPLHFCATHEMDSATECLQELCSTGAAQLTDLGGMLPMHYACTYGTSRDVLKIVADAYPPSVIARDQKGRTPMHLAMANAQQGTNSGAIQFLVEYSNTVTVSVQTSNNSINNFNNNQRTTTTLIEGKKSVDMRDIDGYLPLQLLLQGLREKGNKNHDREDFQKRLVFQKNISDCLLLYLKGEPRASADFLTALQDLPTWALDVAVMAPHVRNVLNQKIIQRFQTFILLLDAYMLAAIIICFEICSDIAVEVRYPHMDSVCSDTLSADTDASAAIHSVSYTVSLTLLFIGVIYFILRELMQVISLITLGNFAIWFEDFTNWLDMCVITCVMYYGILFIPNLCWSAMPDTQAFRCGVVVTKGVLWCALIYDLKAKLVDFAVFVQGVFYVVRRMIPFLASTFFLLVMFAQMFYLIYKNEDICRKRFEYRIVYNATSSGIELLSSIENIKMNQTIETVFLNCADFDDNITSGVNVTTNFTMNTDQSLFYNYDNGNDETLEIPMYNPCTCDYEFPHCSFGGSLRKVYTMMIGEIAGEARYYTNVWAQILYLLFVLFIVLLLSNVLIAIVTDLYETIQYERASIVFWQNRLDFVAEMDAIAYGIRKRVKFLFCCSKDKTDNNESAEQNRRNEELYYDSTSGGFLHRQHHLNDDAFHIEDDPLYEQWESVMDYLFGKHDDFIGANNKNELSWTDLDFYTEHIFYIAFVVFLIPLWMLLGVITAGLLWPPQVRKYLFEQQVTQLSRGEVESKKLEQLKDIDKQIKLVQREMLNEMTHDREDITLINDDFDYFQYEVLQDLLQIKELMSTLLDMGSGGY